MLHTSLQDKPAQDKPAQHKTLRWAAAFVATLIVTALLVAFRGNPAPTPQRVSDLVARIGTLEEENRDQQATLDDLSQRLDALEQLGGKTSAITFDPDVTIPGEWVKNDSSDGIVRYRSDPKWELTSDEPGSFDLWLDDNTAIFLTWDWAYDLLDEINSDEEYLHFFEKDLVASDESVKMTIERSGPVKFMGEDARYWEISMESADGFTARMLSLFYPCYGRASCNLTFARYDADPADDEAVGDFSHDDWTFVNTFAHGIDFLTADKATLTANANLRACPAVNCKVVGRLFRGEIVNLAAISEDGLWYQLDSGEWLAANLVIDAPPDLPISPDDADV